MINTGKWSKSEYKVHIINHVPAKLNLTYALPIVLSLFGIINIACFNSYVSNPRKDKVTKLENIVYVNDKIYEQLIIYIWDDMVLEQRKKTAVSTNVRRDSNHKIEVESATEKVQLTGYFLVDLSKKKYYLFDELNSLRLEGSLPDKREGIVYDWDLTSESGADIDNFIHQKDTVLNSKKYLKLTANESLSSNGNKYEVLLSKDLGISASFRPISDRLSKKYEGIATQYTVTNVASNQTVKGIWKIDSQITNQEMEKVRQYQEWYNSKVNKK